jgi:hypothetical protein
MIDQNHNMRYVLLLSCCMVYLGLDCLWDSNRNPWQRKRWRVAGSTTTIPTVTETSCCFADTDKVQGMKANTDEMETKY